MTFSSLRLPTILAASALLVTAASAKVTEKFSQTHPLAVTGTVSVTNMNGDVQVIAWDKTEVSIEAEKSARDEDALKRIEIIVEASADRVAIKTKHHKAENASWFGRNNDSGAVRYTIRVPAQLARLKVEAMNSNIAAENVRGHVKLETMNGRISASFDRLTGEQKVNVDTMNGQCEIFVPTDASARVVASSMNGRVSSELPMTIEKSSRRSLRGSLGKGEASISMDSMNGSLTIRARS
jgi:DUF4097 and DUF4098 domain-containing protein YvlB